MKQNMEQRRRKRQSMKQQASNQEKSRNELPSETSFPDVRPAQKRCAPQYPATQRSALHRQNTSSATTESVRRSTPVMAMRKRCLDCVGNDYQSVRSCTRIHCKLHRYRLGKRPPKGTADSPLRTIREYCRWCCVGQLSEVRQCPVASCPIYRYRLGLRPESRYREEPTKNAQ